MSEVTGRQGQLASAAQVREERIARADAELRSAEADLDATGLLGRARELAAGQAELLHNETLDHADREYRRAVSLILRGGRAEP